MKVEEAAGEEPSTGGMKLFTLADKAEAFIRPACLSSLPNSTRRQLVEHFGKPSLPCTSAPYLDKVLRPRLPAPVRARDNELAKIQAMSLDGMFPLCRLSGLYEECDVEHINVPPRPTILIKLVGTSAMTCR